MKKQQQLPSVVADTARAVLVVRSDHLEVRGQIAGLLGSLDDTLSCEQVLKEKALRAGGPTFSTIVADKSTKSIATQASQDSHLCRCPKCDQQVDKRKLRDVVFHETDHKPNLRIPRISERPIRARIDEK